MTASSGEVMTLTRTKKAFLKGLRARDQRSTGFVDRR